MSRYQIASETASNLIDYFKPKSVVKQFTDAQGMCLYSDMPLTESLQEKLSALIGFGFEEFAAKDHVTYCKFVSGFGQTNVNYNKNKQRLMVTINV